MSWGSLKPSRSARQKVRFFSKGPILILHTNTLESQKIPRPKCGLKSLKFCITIHATQKGRQKRFWVVRILTDEDLCNLDFGIGLCHPTSRLHVNKTCLKFDEMFVENYWNNMIKMLCTFVIMIRRDHNSCHFEHECYGDSLLFLVCLKIKTLEVIAFLKLDYNRFDLRC